MMRTLICAFCLTALFMTPRAPAAVPVDSNARARTIVSFDPGWKFLKGDAAGAEKPEFQDSSWRSVDVPHDWSIEGPFAESNKSGRGGAYLPTGISWYRKTFTLPADAAQRRIFIDFDGVMANSEVWINGQLLGKRPNGYVPLHYELTGKVKFGEGQANVLAVKTDTTQQPASRWYTGQGIYRHVRLVITDPVHIEHFGTYVTTPQAAADGAVVRVQNTIINQGTSEQKVQIQTTVFDPDGKPVQSQTGTALSAAPGKTVEFEQEIHVSNPKLWSIDQPTIYRAVSKVIAANMVLDDTSTPFGIRSIEFKPATGFWLNGKNVKILGVCLHADGGAVGSAVPLAVWEHRLELLKQIGANAIRCAHNPPAPEFLDLCDRMGFVVMDESFDTWLARKGNADFGYQLYFKDWWEADTQAMVMRDRNHPSLILYSIGNEIRDNLSSPAGQKMLTDQRDVVHKFDPARPVTMGLFRPDINAPYLDLLDVDGFNYRPQLLPQAYKANPQRKTIDTEETHARDRWLQVRDVPSTAGLFVWTGIDYLGETAEADGWPYVISSNASSGFGLMEITGYFRADAYQHQSWWSTKPMIKVVRNLGHGGTGELVSDWTPIDPDTYDAARVEVYTNCDEAELFLNGKSLGTKQRAKDDSALVWQFPYEPGALKAVGRNNGQVAATDELKTAGEPASLSITVDRKKIANDFDDLSHVTVQIVDKAGVVCPNAEQEISFKVEGPGKIAALSTGDRKSHESFQSTQRKAFHGQCLALIKSTANSGAIKLTAQVEGLPPASVELEAAPATGDQR